MSNTRMIALGKFLDRAIAFKHFDFFAVITFRPNLASFAREGAAKLYEYVLV